MFHKDACIWICHTRLLSTYRNTSIKKIPDWNYNSRNPEFISYSPISKELTSFLDFTVLMTPFFLLKSAVNTLIVPLTRQMDNLYGRGITSVTSKPKGMDNWMRYLQSPEHLSNSDRLWEHTKECDKSATIKWHFRLKNRIRIDVECKELVRNPYTLPDSSCARHLPTDLSRLIDNFQRLYSVRLARCLRCFLNFRSCIISQTGILVIHGMKTYFKMGLTLRLKYFSSLLNIRVWKCFI